MTWTTILIPLCLLGTYLLYVNGYLIVQSKTAVTFIGGGLGGRNCFGFSVTRCNGWVRRVLKVKEGGIYCFDLDACLSKGTVQFQVLNAGKLPLLTLDPDIPRGRLQLEAKQRYFIQVQFLHTSGDCKATWEKE